MVKTSQLVLQLRQERLSLGSQPDAHSSSPGSRSFWEIMSHRAWSQMITSPTLISVI